MSTFPSITYWRDYLFSTVYSCLLCHRFIDHKHTGLFLYFLSCYIDLYFWFCASTILCGCVWDFSSFILLSQDCFSYLGSSVLPYCVSIAAAVLPYRRQQWQPTPVLLPRNSHGPNSLVRVFESMGSRRIWHDWEISLSLFTFLHWRRHANPLQCSWLENLRDRGAWWAAIYGVSQSWTWLKQLSSSSSSSSASIQFKYFSFQFYGKWYWKFDRDCFASIDYLRQHGYFNDINS